MKKVREFRLLFILVIGLFFVPNVVFADELDDEFSRIAPGGVIKVNSVQAKSSADIDVLVNYEINKLASKGYWVEAVADPNATDFTNIQLNICKVVQVSTYEECGDRKSFNAKIEYTEANTKVLNYVNTMLGKFKKVNFSDDWMLNGYRIEDLGLINYYYNMNTSGVDNGFYGNLIKYSADFNKVTEGSNLTYKTDLRIGLASDDYLYGGGFGYMIAYYNGVAYSYTDDMAMIENKVLYIPNDTLDNSESYIAAAKKRIKDKLNIDVDIKLGGTLESLKKEVYNKSLSITCDETCALNESETVVDSKILDPNTTDGNYYVFTINNTKVKFFIQKKDLSTVENPVYNGKDIITNISISSDSSIIPLDTSLKVQEINSGEYYDKVSELLETSNFKIFDIKLFSNNKNSYISKLDNGEFIVKIPVPDTLKGKNMIVYYIDENGNKETYPVTVENDVLTFKTKHFSEYTVAELSQENISNPNKETINNPNTYDGIKSWWLVFGSSFIGITATAIYLKKHTI